MHATLCQLCHQRPATSHLTEVSDDQVVTELHACASCLRRLAIDLENSPPPIAIILELAKGTAATGKAPGIHINVAAAPAPGATGDGPTCSNCGLSWDAFRTSNRFGCADCYDAFGDHLSKLLSELQAGPEHLGRLPKNLHQIDMLAALLSRRAELRQELDLAIAQENFERAAELRDALIELEQAHATRPPDQEAGDHVDS